MKSTYDEDTYKVTFDFRDDKPNKSIFYNPEETQEGLQKDKPKVKPRTTSEIINSKNVAELLTEEELLSISHRCVQGLEEDKKSIENWLETADKAMALTKVDFTEKNQPFRKAANINYPLVDTASLQWTSRILAEMFKNGDLASYKCIGQDTGLYDQQGQLVVAPGFKKRKGRRISTYVNWQTMEKIPNWLAQKDALYRQLSIVGTCFIKTWFDPVEQLIRSELCAYDNLIINNAAESLEKAPRISEYVNFTTESIISNIRQGVFLDLDVYGLPKDMTDYDAVYHECVEQHCTLDLDGDGYPEPYIVTIHMASSKVMRIVARYEEKDIVYNDKKQIAIIYPELYYTDYHFIPSADKSFFSIGFGTLLLNHNYTINTILNQLIDAGHLACIQGGFLAQGTNIKSGKMMFDPGEWKPMTTQDGNSLKDSIVPLNYKEPSLVLFQLVQYLIESGEKLSATTDAMTGSQDATNVSPNTIMQLIGESQKVYNSIFRRVFRGLKKELRRLMVLNSLHINVDEYLSVVDPSPQEIQEMFINGQLVDFDLTSVDVVPVVDINESTQQQALAKSEYMKQLAQIFAPLGAVKPNAMAQYCMDAAEVDESEKYVVPDPPPGTPDPAAIKIQLDQANFDSQMKLKVAEHELKQQEAAAKIELQKAQAAKALSDADATHESAQLDVYKTAIDKNIRQEQNQIAMVKAKLDAQTKTDATVSKHLLSENDQQVKRDIAKMTKDSKPSGDTK